MTEFGFIEHLRNLCKSLPDGGFEGIGDDCAIYPIGDGDSLVITTDALNEGIHFLRHATSAAEIGAKSLAVNISDVAAMGAKPIASLLAIGIPADLPKGWIEDFTQGYIEASKRYGVALIGGDTTASVSGITITVTAIGRAKSCNIKRRSAAKVGDTILVASPLGGSAVGLHDILSGQLSTAAADTHRNPKPQIVEGQWFGEQPCVHAMMDLSDGLASDLRHILEESKVGAEVEVNSIPLYEGATIEQAVSGGEDYKLLLTADSNAIDLLSQQFLDRFGCKLYPIGSIVANGEHKIKWLKEGVEITPEWRGFEHF